MFFLKKLVINVKLLKRKAKCLFYFILILLITYNNHGCSMTWEVLLLVSDSLVRLAPELLLITFYSN
jgi:hypothetical protein